MLFIYYKPYYKSEEEIDGLKWEKKGGAPGEEIALTTRRRLTVKQLPQTLIMYLSRFETDYFQDPPATVKINDRFEFPENLNMKKYTKEGREMGEEGGEEGEDGAGEAAGDEGGAAASGEVDSGEGKGGDAGAHPDEYYQYKVNRLY